MTSSTKAHPVTRMGRLIGCAFVVAVFGALLVVVAEPAAAQVASLDAGEQVCNFGVFGRTPTPGDSLVDDAIALDGLTHADYVQWSSDMGFSMVGSCVARLNAPFVADPIGSLRVHPLTSEPGGLWRYQPLPTGPEMLRAVGSGHSVICRMGLDRGFDTPCNRAGHYSNPDVLVDYHRPLLTSIDRADDVVRYAFRVDVLPFEGDCAVGGDFGCPTAYSTFLVPRASWAPCVQNEQGTAMHICQVVTSKGGSYSDTPQGQSEALPFPEVTDTEGMPEPGGTCVINGWTLVNVEDERQWTSDSPDHLDVVLTDGHEHRLMVYFQGDPSVIQVQARTHSGPIWTRQLNRPPEGGAFFTGLMGTGELVTIAVSCIGADGDIDPAGQAVITAQDKERPGLGDCLGTEEFSLTSPGSWVRYGVNGVGCVLSWAFIPTKPMSERFYELRATSQGAALASTSVAAAGAGFSSLSTTGPSNCGGPTISVSVPQLGVTGDDYQVLSVCEGSNLAGPAAVVKTILAGALGLAVLFKLWAIFTSAWRGDSVPVYGGEGRWTSENQWEAW